MNNMLRIVQEIYTAEMLATQIHSTPVAHLRNRQVIKTNAIVLKQVSNPVCENSEWHSAHMGGEPRATLRLPNAHPKQHKT